MRVSAQYAEQHIAELFLAASNGEEVEIALQNKPALKLTATGPLPRLRKTGRRILGGGRGELRVPSEEEWQEMDKELERLMNDAPLLSSGEI